MSLEEIVVDPKTSISGVGKPTQEEKDQEALIDDQNPLLDDDLQVCRDFGLNFNIAHILLTQI